MLRLRLFIAIVAVLAIVNTVAFVSCTKEKPTAPTPEMPFIAMSIDTIPDRDTPLMAQEWYLQTSEQLDTLLDTNYGPTVLNGDILRLKADTLFSLGTKRYPYKRMGITIVGDSPRPTIESTLNAGTDPVLFFGDNDQTDRFVVRNVKLDRSTSNYNFSFFKLNLFRSVLFEDVYGDMGASNIFAWAVHDTFRDCEFLSADVSVSLKTFNDDSDIVSSVHRCLDAGEAILRQEQVGDGRHSRYRNHASGGELVWHRSGAGLSHGQGSAGRARR